jgi:hypothetical protein
LIGCLALHHFGAYTDRIGIGPDCFLGGKIFGGREIRKMAEKLDFLSEGRD